MIHLELCLLKRWQPRGLFLLLHRFDLDGLELVSLRFREGLELMSSFIAGPR